MAIKTVAYVGFAENIGKSKSEVYDLDYGKCTPQTGNKAVRSPYKLGLLRNGEILMDAPEFELLMQPTWGETNDKVFVDTLPYIEKTESPTITVSNWKKYPEVIPTETAPTVLYKIRKYYSPGVYIYYQDAPYSEYWWNVMGVEEWLLVGACF